MNNKYKILIIEDEAHISNVLKAVLESEGYQSIEAVSGKEGEMMYASYRPDLIVLDLGLPDQDGKEIIRKVRADSVIPIIVLSARTDETEKVMALDLGANDYVTKPFGMQELIARIRSALRAQRMILSGSGAPSGEIRIGDLVIDYATRQITAGGREVKMTQNEFNILALLAEQSGKVLTYQMITKQIWGVSDNASVKRLQVNMANIRKKLNERPGENKYILNELGVGYRMYKPAQE